MTKNSGTKKMANTVAEMMPPSTLVPMADCAPEAAPVANANGSKQSSFLS